MKENKIEKIRYAGWENCYRLKNRLVEVIATADVGPRIIRYAFLNEENEFGEYKSELGRIGDKEWLAYGGHRLWHAPEGMPRSYSPDNNPVKVKIEKSTLKLIQQIEPDTKVQKEMEITIGDVGSEVTVVHRLINKNLWQIELSVWALTVMSKGGFAIIPQEPYVSHQEALLPVRPLVLWAYTDMSDSRWKWSKKYIILHQDEKAQLPQKIGALVKSGWCAYARKNHLFLKLFKYKKDSIYPDFGCTVEIFTDKDMLELETLGPLIKLNPGESLEHIEKWFLFREINVKPNDESIDCTVLQKVKS